MLLFFHFLSNQYTWINFSIVVLGKIMESIIANRMRDFYCETGFLSPVQHGFRRVEGVDELLLLLRSGGQN